jgi:hypothetical protein
MPDPPATMRATFASEPRAGARRSMDMLLKMKVRIEQADMPAGLAKLLNVAGESLSQRRSTLVSEDQRTDEAAEDTAADEQGRAETRAEDTESRTDAQAAKPKHKPRRPPKMKVR